MTPHRNPQCRRGLPASRPGAEDPPHPHEQVARGAHGKRRSRVVTLVHGLPRRFEHEPSERQIPGGGASTVLLVRHGTQKFKPRRSCSKAAALRSVVFALQIIFRVVDFVVSVLDRLNVRENFLGLRDNSSNDSLLFHHRVLLQRGWIACRWAPRQSDWRVFPRRRFSVPRCDGAKAPCSSAEELGGGPSFR